MIDVQVMPVRRPIRTDSIPANPVGKMTPTFSNKRGSHHVETRRAGRKCKNHIYGCESILSKYNLGKECEACRLRRQRFGE
jgi:hypothetical protein